MKKGLSVLLAGIFLVAVAVSGQAASVDWDKIRTPSGTAASAPGGTADVEEGGTYWYKLGQPGSNVPPLPSLQTSGDSGGFGATVDNQLLVTHNDTVAGKLINWTSDAHQSTATEPGGVAHTTAARYMVNDPSAWVQVGYVDAFSTSSRSFLPIGGGDISISAQLSNLPTWENNNYDFTSSPPGAEVPSNPIYNAWRVVGGVQIDEITLEPGGSGVVSSEIVASITLDSLSLQGTDDTILIGFDDFTPVVQDDVYYELLVQLSADLVMNNIDPLFGIVGTIPNLLEIGSWINPLQAPVVLSALVDQQAVPIPGSLVLLFSGWGGLTIIRRRVLSKT